MVAGKIWKLDMDEAKCIRLRKVIVRRNLSSWRFIIAIQLCNATAKLIGIIGKVWQVFSSARPVQLAIIHALEKQRVDVADFFGNNLGDKSYKSMAKAECKLDTVSQKIVLVCLKQGPFHLPLPSSK